VATSCSQALVAMLLFLVYRTHTPIRETPEGERHNKLNGLRCKFDIEDARMRFCLCRRVAAP
jgi:hypothetical protein